MSQQLLQDTIAAIATSQGRSGICVLRLSGVDAITIAAKLLRAPNKLFSALGHTSFHAPILDRNGEELDDVVISVFRAPNSFTGEESVEISAHGSEAITHSILAELIHFGARLAERGEFSRRAFFHQKLDLEALELTRARIDASSPIALRGTNLAIHEKFERLKQAYNTTLRLLAEVNAEIDFGESDHVSITNFNDRLNEAIATLRELLEVAKATAANSATFTVALIGPPNVGKSSLFNKLVNFRRSIVSDVPGTTRDYVEAFLDLDGVQVKLVDTAGHRSAVDEIEAEGIELGSRAAIHADLTLQVTDPTTRNIAPEQGVMLVHNKSDLDSIVDGLVVSALTGDGLESLRNFLRQKAAAAEQEAGQLRISLHERQTISSVIERLSYLCASTATSTFDPVIIAEELRTAISEIGSLLGVNISEDALNLIFASMCIGK